MSIIAPSDFKYPNNVPNNDTLPVQAQLQNQIDGYEPEFLTKLLGPDLYADLLAGLLIDPVEQKWTDLVNQCKKSIINYVYYFYNEEAISYVSGIGTVQGKSDNAVSVSAWDIMVKTWNKMVDMNRVVHKFLVDNPTDYPNYVYDNTPSNYFWGEWFWRNECIPEIYTYKNTLDI